MDQLGLDLAPPSRDRYGRFIPQNKPDPKMIIEAGTKRLLAAVEADEAARGVTYVHRHFRGASHHA